MQDPSYAPYLGQLAKLVFLASSMHQLTVSVCSSLPFVIGQVGCQHQNVSEIKGIAHVDLTC